MDRSVKIPAGDMEGGASHKVKLANIKNPATTSSTGWFQVSTVAGDNIIDMDPNFATTASKAVSVSISGVSSALDTTNFEGSMSDRAGELGTYTFAFTPNSVITTDMAIRVVFPKDMNLEQVLTNDCGAMLYNEKTVAGQIYCL
jgi:hypothetical protein